MGVTPSFRRCPVTTRHRPRPPAGTPHPGRAPLGRTGAPHLPRRDPLPSAPRQNPDPALPHGAARPGHPHPHPAPRAPRRPRNPEAGCPRGQGDAGAAQEGRDSWEAAPAGSPGPRTHLSLSAGALAALRGVSSAADRGTRLTSARRRRTVGYPRKWAGPRGKPRPSEDLNALSLRLGSGCLSRTRQSTPLPRLRLSAPPSQMVLFIMCKRPFAKGFH